MADAPTLALWRLATVIERTGLGRSTIYRRISEQTFPAPRDLGGGTVAWRSDDILRWIEACPIAAGHKPGPGQTNPKNTHTSPTS